MTAALTAPVAEIFSSVQGEGIRLGEPQIFVRFAGCPWRCSYCDTPDGLTEAGHPSLTLEEVLVRIDKVREKNRHQSVSLTGGEPVLQADFLTALIPGLKSRGLSIHLETSATHPALFKKFAALCDVVAADIKLPSAIGRPFWEEHRAFFELAGSAAFAKIVLTATTGDEEFERALELLADLRPVPPLILQPVTAMADLESRLNFRSAETVTFVRPPAPARTAALFKHALARLPRVSLIPQMHPIWGVP